MTTGNGATMRMLGGALLGLGALFALIGFGMDTTAEYSSTLNIGLLNDQSNAITAGGFMAVCGAIFYAAGSVIRELALHGQATAIEGGE